MTFYEDLPEPALETPVLPQSALCLKVPGTLPEELVVHRDGVTDLVFLFEALDDAVECALQVEAALGFQPALGRVRTEDLSFRIARFKPAVGETVDLPLERV